MYVYVYLQSVRKEKTMSFRLSDGNTSYECWTSLALRSLSNTDPFRRRSDQIWPAA